MLGVLTEEMEKIARVEDNYRNKILILGTRSREVSLGNEAIGCMVFIGQIFEDEQIIGNLLSHSSHHKLCEIIAFHSKSSLERLMNDSAGVSGLASTTLSPRVRLPS